MSYSVKVHFLFFLNFIQEIHNVMKYLIRLTIDKDLTGQTQCQLSR